MASGRSSNKIAVLALISLLPIFMWVVGDGWTEILAPYLTDSFPNPTIAKYAITAAGYTIAFIAVILAWAVASERARLQVEDFAKTAWIAYIGVLFTLSAVGTINFLFMKFEAKTYIKDMALTTEQQLGALERTIQRDLTTPKSDIMKQEQEAYKIKLRALEVQFKGAVEAGQRKIDADHGQLRNEINKLVDYFETEVRNPLRSGCGEVAQKYLNDIRKLLPDLQLPSGGCQQSTPDVMLAAYKAAIQKALDRRLTNGSACAISPEARKIAGDIEDIIKVPPTTLSGTCPNANTAIQETSKSILSYIGGMPSFAPGEQQRVDLRDKSVLNLQKQKKLIDDYLTKSNQNKDNAAEVLKPIWGEYRSVYDSVKGAINPDSMTTLPSIIDDPRLDQIGNFINTVEILLTRYDRVKTYVIILLGLLLDLILITFFARIEMVRYRRPTRTAHEERLRQIHSSFDDD